VVIEVAGTLEVDEFMNGGRILALGLIGV